MAQKVQVLLVDDLDGGTADETVTFALDGVTYEIDLSAENAEKLREAFALYVGSARRVGGNRNGGTRTARRASNGTAPRGGENNTAQIREWARQNGHKVNERGRIPAGILEAYQQANG